MVVLRQKSLYSVKVVELGQKKFYSGKSCCFHHKEVVLGQMVVFEKNCCIPDKEVVLGQMVVFEQSGCIPV